MKPTFSTHHTPLSTPEMAGSTAVGTNGVNLGSGPRGHRAGCGLEIDSLAEQRVFEGGAGKPVHADSLAARLMGLTIPFPMITIWLCNQVVIRGPRNPVL